MESNAINKKEWYGILGSPHKVTTFRKQEPVALKEEINYIIEWV